MLYRNLGDLQESDLESLRGNHVPEDTGLDYKLALPGNDSKSKVEFLADVSSLANAGGGDIIFGIREKKGPGNYLNWSDRSN